MTFDLPTRPQYGIINNRGDNNFGDGMKQITGFLMLALFSILSCKTQQAELGENSSEVSSITDDKYAVGLRLAKDHEKHVLGMIEKTGFGFYEFVLCKNTSRFEIDDNSCSPIFEKDGKPSYFLYTNAKYKKQTSAFMVEAGLIGKTEEEIRIKLNNLLRDQNSSWSQFVNTSEQFLVVTGAITAQGATAAIGAAGVSCAGGALVGALTAGMLSAPACVTAGAIGGMFAGFTGAAIAAMTLVEENSPSSLAVKYVKDKQIRTKELNKSLSTALGDIFNPDDFKDITYFKNGSFNTADLMINLKENYFTNLQFSEDSHVRLWLSTSTTH